MQDLHWTAKVAAAASSRRLETDHRLVQRQLWCSGNLGSGGSPFAGSGNLVEMRATRFLLACVKKAKLAGRSPVHDCFYAFFFATVRLCPSCAEPSLSSGTSNSRKFFS